MMSFVLGGGCFWCLDAAYRVLSGVTDVVSGYCGGTSDSPTYEQVCGGNTGHAEVVRVDFDETVIPADVILDAFFTMHDPRQLNRQGNDVGTQYRSAIFATDAAQLAAAELSRDRFDTILQAKRFDAITTEVAPAGPFYYAEDYHQQYLARNPNGYCGLGGTGVSCPVGIANADANLD
jgi:peptide-methionine (S)-S-oxide reductase